MFLKDAPQRLLCPTLYSPKPGQFPRFPLREMEVGEAFTMVGGPDDARKLKQSATRAGKYYCRVFKVYKLDVGEWRCQRIL